MSIELGSDVLYLPKVVQNSGGNPAGINYGLLCITDQNLYYIPKHTLDMKRIGTLSETYDVKEQKVKKYDGMNFEDVVPEMAKEIDGKENFDKFLSEMARGIDGSCVIRLSEIHQCQFGFFAQFTFLKGQEKYRFSVGGKAKREAVKTFLQGRCSRSPKK